MERPLLIGMFKLKKYFGIFLYNLFCLIPIKKNRIILESWKGNAFTGSISCLYEKIKYDNRFEIIVINNNNLKCELSQNTKIIRTKSIKHLYYLATANKVIYNTLYYSFLRKRKRMDYIMIWHASGFFKKFGLSTAKNKNEIRVYKKNAKILDFLVVSHESVVDIYSKELDVEKGKIIPIGLPRTDMFINQDRNLVKKKVVGKYDLKDKYIILYLPTFREEGGEVFNSIIDLDRMDRELPSDCILLVKAHSNSKVIDNGMKYSRIRILRETEEINELMIASDMLISDYSSVIFDYSILNKPIIFFAKDIEGYQERYRKFYHSYFQFVPGSVVEDITSLLGCIKNEKCKEVDNSEFAKRYQKIDGRAGERFIELFLRGDR